MKFHCGRSYVHDYVALAIHVSPINYLRNTMRTVWLSDCNFMLEYIQCPGRHPCIIWLYTWDLYQLPALGRLAMGTLIFHGTGHIFSNREWTQAGINIYSHYSHCWSIGFMCHKPTITWNKAKPLYTCVACQCHTDGLVMDDQGWLSCWLNPKVMFTSVTMGEQCSTGNIMAKIAQWHPHFHSH